MKKNIIKYIIFLFLLVIVVTLITFFSAHLIVQAVWLYTQGVAHSMLKLMMVRWFSIPLFGLLISILSLFHFISASKKEKKNYKFLKIKTVFIFILASVCEYFLHISQALLDTILGGMTGIIDPLTKLDMSFYLLWLPLIEKVSIFTIIYGSTLIIFRVFYPVKQNISFIDKCILLLVLFFTFVLVALFRLEAMYNINTTYIGYMDIYGTIIPLMVFLLWTFMFIVVAVLFLSIRSKAMWLGFLLTALVFVGANILWPMYLNRFIYTPNQSALQEKFAGIHAESTRRSFALDKIVRNNSLMITDEELPVVIEKNFWKDALHFVQVAQRNQEILPIFEINNATPLLLSNDQGDINPYFISIRDSVCEVNDLWDIKHMRNMFGYGAVIGSANSFDKDGYPEFLLKDLELATTDTNVIINNPHIFFSEFYEEYAFINTTMLIPDFSKQNFPLEKQVFERVKGIPMNFFMRVLLMIIYRDSRFLLTDYFTEKTQLILKRKPTDIIQNIFPQFSYDTPRMIYFNKELWWEIDMYSLSDSIILSKSVETPWGEYNWVRSSIKAYVSAYSGEVIFNIMNNSDPYVRIVKKLYPRLFDKKINISTDKYLYPVTLFDVQSQLLTVYHDFSAASFYSGFNKREITRNVETGLEENIKNRILIDKNKIAFQRTYTPEGKNIFSAQLIAYIDDQKNYQLQLYEAPANLGIPGLAQAEAFLNQDPEFSRLATLWGQRGSKISSSDMVFYSMEDRGIYLRTIFLDSEMISTPLAAQFTLIDSTTVTLGSTINELASKTSRLLRVDDFLPISEEQQLTNIIIEAYQYYLNAETARIGGNTQEYRENVDKIGEILQQIDPQ